MDKKEENDVKLGQDNPGLELEPGDVEAHQVNSNTNDVIVKVHDECEAFFEDLPPNEPNIMDKCLVQMWSILGNLFTQRRHVTKAVMWAILAVLYYAYFFWAVYHYTTNNSEEEEIEWCDGLGFLIIVTVVVHIGLLYGYAIKPLARFLSQLKPVKKGLCKGQQQWDTFMAFRYSSAIINSIVIGAVVIFLIVDTADDRRRLLSFLGLVILVLLGTLGSKHPSRIVWRQIMWGLALQFIFGLLILRWNVGRNIFQCLGDKVSIFLAYTDEGSGFVYGYLVTQQPFFSWELDVNSTAYQVTTDINTHKAIGFVFVFKVLSVIFFFSFMVNMMFYVGAMQWLIEKIGWILQVTVGTTACESMNAAGNIFIGQTETPLMIKPFLPKMTNSELHTVMASGMATISGSVLAAYISFNVSASHLLSASVMSAPAALAAAKLIMPETKKSRTAADAIEKIPRGQEANILDAASQGAVTAVFLVANIAGTLIAFLAFIGFINGVLGWCCELIGYDGITFQFVLGKIFIPLSWIMGVEAKDQEVVGALVGIKSFVNEFAAYDQLNKVEHLISARSKVIATYALCGFSNPASVGIQIAAFSTLAPTRRADFSRLAFRAYIAGSMACFLTACVAGTLLSEATIE